MLKKILFYKSINSPDIFVHLILTLILKNFYKISLLETPCLNYCLDASQNQAEKLATAVRCHYLIFYGNVSDK
jgi:hypothetical protein